MLGYSVGEFDVLEYWAEGPDQHGLMLRVSRGDIGVEIGPPGAEPDWADGGVEVVERWSKRSHCCLIDFGLSPERALDLLSDVYGFPVELFVDISSSRTN